MCSRVFIFLIGAVHVYHQVFAADTFSGAMTVEANVTLDTTSILSILNMLHDLQVNSTQTVTVLQNTLIADCLLYGTNTSCNCSTEYTWSNDVCYSFNCCNEATCKANVSYTPILCVPKVNVQIYGSVSLSSGTWGASQTAKLQGALAALNGFQNLTITNYRESYKIADFYASVNVRFMTSKLQGILANLENDLTATALANTSGMVTIVSPNTSVCYESSPVLTCTFMEAMTSAGWTMKRDNKSYVLNPGSVVELNNNCATQSDSSCTQLTLKKVTGSWAGIYQCVFTTNRITHAATTQLNVALLPDVITVVNTPPTGDCTQPVSNVSINVSATIPQSTEIYEVSWSYSGGPSTKLVNKTVNNNLVYSFIVTLSCKPPASTQNITFTNTKKQDRIKPLNIDIIYNGSIFCPAETAEVYWPNTTAGLTVTNVSCENGTVGYKSRTCNGKTWQPVVSFCINQKLKNVSNQAEDFRKGQDATQQMAINIFEGLLNTSLLPSSNTSSFADIDASINVLNVMANASTVTALQEEVLPNFIKAASNILNKTWDTVNNSVLYNMSSTYLESVENLVKNIKVVNSTGVNSTNLELKFCSSGNCNMSVFNIGVSMNKTNGTLKTVAIKQLSDKLRPNNSQIANSLILSATLENNSDSSLEIQLDFPNELLNYTKPVCVFWNTTDGNWSDTGCFANVNASEANHTLCECNHLTPFSILMSKGDEIKDTDENLNIITNVGLAVSVFSLLIFLIIEFLVWSAVVKSHLSHFRHTAMVNIATFLLLANCSFLASTSPSILSETLCLVLTICKHLFYLATFCWMLCMSFMLVHQLIFVFSPLRKRVFLFFSGFVGYVCPILIVGSSYVYFNYFHNNYYDKKSCWLIYDGLLKGSMYAFLLPVGTIILTNIFCMVVVILTLVKSAVPDGSRADDKDTVKSILKVVVFLTPIFGVTWVFGFVILLLDKAHSMYTAAKWSFIILNSFQGLFILLTGVLSEKRVQNELCMILKGKSKGKSDSMKNLISSRPTEEK